MTTTDIWKELQNAALRDGLSPSAPHPLQQGIDELLRALCGIHGLYYNIVETLIAHGADARQNGDACMLAAAAADDVRMMRLLHERAGIPYDTGRGGPLRAAAEHNGLDAVPFLLNATPHHIGDRNKALAAARSNGHVRIEQVLRAAGAYDPDTETNPLHRPLCPRAPS